MQPSGEICDVNHKAMSEQVKHAAKVHDELFLPASQPASQPASSMIKFAAQLYVYKKVDVGWNNINVSMMA